MKIKLVATDLDGTLLNEIGEGSALTRQVFIAPTKNEIGFPEKEAYLIFFCILQQQPEDLQIQRSTAVSDAVLYLPYGYH